MEQYTLIGHPLGHSMSPFIHERLFAMAGREASYTLTDIAPEHLEIMTENPKALLPQILNAGAVFLGQNTPEPLGDYMAGPCHVLPTSGTARFFSPLSVESFLKRTSLVDFSREALAACREDIVALALSEGLTAHANSIQVRFPDDE